MAYRRVPLHLAPSKGDQLPQPHLGLQRAWVEAHRALQAKAPGDLGIDRPAAEGGHNVGRLGIRLRHGDSQAARDLARQPVQGDRFGMHGHVHEHALRQPVPEGRGDIHAALAGFADQVRLGLGIVAEPDVSLTQRGPHADLGIRFSKLGYRQTSAFVERVRAASPAAIAGMKADDLIIAVEGHRDPLAERRIKLTEPRLEMRGRRVGKRRVAG